MFSSVLWFLDVILDLFKSFFTSRFSRHSLWGKKNTKPKSIGNITASTLTTACFTSCCSYKSLSSLHPSVISILWGYLPSPIYHCKPLHLFVAYLCICNTQAKIPKDSASTLTFSILQEVCSKLGEVFLHTCARHYGVRLSKEEIIIPPLLFCTLFIIMVHERGPSGTAQINSSNRPSSILLKTTSTLSWLLWDLLSPPLWWNKVPVCLSTIQHKGVPAEYSYTEGYAQGQRPVQCSSTRDGLLSQKYFILWVDETSKAEEKRCSKGKESILFNNTLSSSFLDHGFTKNVPFPTFLYYRGFFGE